MAWEYLNVSAIEVWARTCGSVILTFILLGITFVAIFYAKTSQKTRKAAALAKKAELIKKYGSEAKIPKKAVKSGDYVGRA